MTRNDFAAHVRDIIEAQSALWDRLGDLERALRADGQEVEVESEMFADAAACTVPGELVDVAVVNQLVEELLERLELKVTE